LLARANTRSFAQLRIIVNRNNSPRNAREVARAKIAYMRAVVAGNSSAAKPARMNMLAPPVDGVLIVVKRVRAFMKHWAVANHF